jgi:hypothetical protein
MASNEGAAREIAHQASIHFFVEAGVEAIPALVRIAAGSLLLSTF